MEESQSYMTNPMKAMLAKTNYNMFNSKLNKNTHRSKRLTTVAPLC